MTSKIKEARRLKKLRLSVIGRRKIRKAMMPLTLISRQVILNIKNKETKYELLIETKKNLKENLNVWIQNR